ncbi:MAG: DegT/DnrJ/EryC1/StrS family aminotransferase, partial [Elusimicrobiota bacterium]|nr:DegT/DnrJ/EryC1/StrS family aminotransferase [Elusimicrobiota bacterium]
ASPFIGKEERRLINEVLDSRILASGKYVETFEKQFADYCGVKYAIANNNGTAALHTALIACGIKSGDKVVTTPFSFIATSNSILFCAAKPIFADIDPKTFNIDPVSLEKILIKEKNVKAVIVVHLYGLMCDMDAIMKLKKKYKFKLIEDCAQAHGALYKGKKAGSFGDAAAFSFYATKNMMTGEGGMTLVSDAKADKYARQIINHGRDGHSTFTVLGYNYRMTNLEAAIGIAQLKQIENWIEKRNENAAKYARAFEDLDFIKIPFIPKGQRHVFHQYTIRIKSQNRTDFMDYLKGKGVGCGIYYDTVLYRQPYYKKLGYKAGICPIAEETVKEVVSIPVHPLLSNEDRNIIINAVRGYLK